MTFLINMDKSDLQTLIRFALQNNIMNKSFLQVFKWHNIQNSLAYNQYNKNIINTSIINL